LDVKSSAPSGDTRTLQSAMDVFLLDATDDEQLVPVVEVESVRSNAGGDAAMASAA